LETSLTRSLWRLGVLIGLIVGRAVSAPAQTAGGAGSSSSTAAALDSIDAFLAEPLTYDGFFRGRALVRMAEQRPDVLVVLTRYVAPWICEHLELAVPDTSHFDLHDDRWMYRSLGERRSMIYLAGNMRAQLATGRRGDQPYAGARTVLHASDSRSLRGRALGEHPEVRHWAALESAGALRPYMDSLAALPNDPCSTVGGQARPN